MIKCPKCESTSNQVTITRTGRGVNEIRTDLNYTYRRRKCLNCGFMFSTRELTEEEYKKSIKFLDSREPGSTIHIKVKGCLLYTSPSPRDRTRSRMPSSA